MKSILTIEGKELFKADAKLLSLKELAVKYGMKECTVSKWKKKLDVLTVPKNIQLPDKEQFEKDIKLYPNTEVAKMYGVGLRLISKWRKRLGLTNVWRSELWDVEQFKKDAVRLRGKDMCIKYGIMKSDLGYWKLKYGLTTGKKEDRVITWIESKNGCWLCTSHKINAFGYPQCKGERIVAVRLWVEKNGEWPVDKVCCHSCDNPACINPEHIFPGTKKENSEGMAERNRSPWGWRNGVRKLTPDEARAIYELKDSGMTQRAVGEKFGISGSNVFYIWKGATWWRDVAGMKNFDEKLTKR